ncbi:MAG: hypothetical protein HPY71_10255 [Firmicutes bacterium]|nr:hypothetical protein [Bacillota bacterium]
MILPSSSLEDILQWILLAIHQVRDNRVNPVPILELAKLLLIYPILEFQRCCSIVMNFHHFRMAVD